jgi:tRNA (guanine-N7-)-methyltransferase
MRIRYKPWARPELDACPYYVKDGSSVKGRWHERFADIHHTPARPLYAELGCGKGAWVSQAAYENRGINWSACDIKSEMLAYTRRKTEKLFAEKSITEQARPEQANPEQASLENSSSVNNLILLTLNIEKTFEVFGENELDRIYINFCPPWKREREFKHCLTHPKMLVSYAKILKPGAEIRFKTDDDRLFEDSLRWFSETGFVVTQIERDLHNSGVTDNIVTEHERMFAEQGKTIKFCVAVNTTKRSVEG